MSRNILRFILGFAFLALATASQAQVVISQVYGGGGNTSAQYQNDFIEIFNRGSVAVDITGWSVQYTSSAGTAWLTTNLTPSLTVPGGMLQPGQYFLIQGASGGAVGAALPTADATGTLNLSGTKGKVALVSSTTALSGNCATGASVQDFVGYGAANCSETNPTAAPSNTTAAIRNTSGCDDTDNNIADFTIAAPTPRNSATTTHSCGGASGITLSIDNVSHNEGNSGTTSFDFTVTLSAPAPVGGVTFDIATADNTATTADNDYTGRTLTGQTIAEGNTTYLFAVLVNGDTTPEPNEIFYANVSNIVGTGVTTISAQGTGTIVNDDIPVLTIGAIQGNGDASPYVGQTVTTAGGSVVTVLTTNGFYMQDPPGSSDGNPDTSDGIYVYTGSAPLVAVGDIVTVTGSLSEFNGTTEFNSGSTVTMTGAGAPITPMVLDISLPSPNPTTHYCQGSLSSSNPNAVAEGNWECLESMLVQVDGVVVGATNGGFAADGTHPGTPGFFYATVNNAPRPFRESGIAYPANVPGYTGPIWDGDPEIIEFYPKSLVGAPPAQVFDAGQQFTSTAIVSDYQGAYELYPVTLSTVGSAPNTVQPVPDPAAGTLTIASQNTLHFFNDVNDPGSADDCAIQGTNDTCETPAQFAIRLSKLSLQVRNVLKAPAVVGVQEVENLATLQSLATQINTDDPSLSYTPYLDEGNDIGGIDVGFLVRSDVTVNSVTQIGMGTTTDDGCSSGSSCLLNDRPPLLLDASFAGQRFAVLVIHSRSLSGVDTAARVRRKRLEQAQYVGAIVQAWQTGSGSDVVLTSPDAHVTLGATGETVPKADGSVPIVVVGDYNAYEFTDGYTDVTGQIKGTAVQADNTDWEAPITTPTFCDAGLTTAAATRYSFSFDGYVQELDHSLLSRVAWTDFVSLHNAHGNADTSEAGSAVTDPNTPARSADHDGQVLTLAVDRIFADGYEGDTCR
ncbi:MAG: lamin tail domain-containing protein [Rudaea sp.]